MKFSITKTMRGDKIAFWINIPAAWLDEDKFNIWDVPKELAANPDFEGAIRRAFELGVLAQRNLVSRTIRESHSYSLVSKEEP